MQLTVHWLFQLNFINILIFSLSVLEFDFNLTNQSYLILKIFSFILLLNYSSYIIFSHNDYIKHKKINKFLFFFFSFFDWTCMNVIVFQTLINVSKRNLGTHGNHIAL